MAVSKRDAAAVKAALAAIKIRDTGVTWLELVEQIAQELAVSVDDVCGASRSSPVTLARHRAWAALRSAGYSLQEIATRWQAHHTTVMLALRGANPPKQVQLFGLTADAYQALRGFGPVCDAVERAEWWLDPAQHLGAVSERNARDALAALEGAAELVAEQGPRGDGARFALESLGGKARLTEIRDRAQEIIGRATWERAEAAIAAGAVVEPVEA